MTDRADWIRLTKTGASARRLNRLLDHFGSPAALFAAPAREVGAACGSNPETARKLLDPAHIPTEREISLIDELGVTFLTRSDPSYPLSLRGIPDPPPAIYVLGTLEPRDHRAVGLVGSRRCSEYGRRVAKSLATDLAAAGVTVVSGLARGVDTTAHRGALEAGGRTIACLGCGVDVHYPPENKPLYTDIAASGAVISEYPLLAAPDAWHFPSRNRIISGLSQAVVIIEAPAGSGALITADAALEQGREVFAVPGSVENWRSRGPHNLLRQGAVLCESAEDILREMGWLPGQQTLNLGLDEHTGPPPIPADLPAPEARLLLLLDHEAKPVDDLIQESNLAASVVGASLVTLELKGFVRRLPGNAYIRLTR